MLTSTVDTFSEKALKNINFEIIDSEVTDMISSRLKAEFETFYFE